MHWADKRVLRKEQVVGEGSVGGRSEGGRAVCLTAENSLDDSFSFILVCRLCGAQHTHFVALNTKVKNNSVCWPASKQ